MDSGTRLRTILAIATSLNTALIATDITGFQNEKADFIYKVISLVLNFVIVALATYFNNDYTEIASEKTGEMRQAKEEAKDGYVGERFYSDDDREDQDEEESI